MDIYNEGVDIPEVNTVLFLRPTESLTVFLQQLGRGLRLSEDKECLTVLDFIGQANKKYNFEDKFAALLSNTTRSVTREIKQYLIRVKEERQEKAVAKRERNMRQYPRGGEPWTKEEESHLLSMHRSGCNIYQIAIL